MYKLVLLRHGESIWNRENLFTGWTDVGLSANGLQEAIDGGRQLHKDGFVFDVAFTSVLKRAIKTLWVALEEMDRVWIPIHNTWRLNERHYGALQGLNKAQTAEKYGEAQVKIWRRSYDIRPPALSPDDDRYPGKDPRYAGVSPADLPVAECLKDTVARTLPYWHQTIAPVVRSGRRVIIAAHGNSLRGLVKYLDNIPDDEIVGLNIPTGIPLVYELDDDLKPLRHFYLGDPEAVARAAQAVADQASEKPDPDATARLSVLSANPRKLITCQHIDNPGGSQSTSHGNQSGMFLRNTPDDLRLASQRMGPHSRQDSIGLRRLDDRHQFPFVRDVHRIKSQQLTGALHQLRNWNGGFIEPHPHPRLPGNLI